MILTPPAVASSTLDLSRPRQGSWVDPLQRTGVWAVRYDQAGLEPVSMHSRPRLGERFHSATPSGLTAGFSMTLAAYLARLEVLGTRAGRAIRALPSHDRVVLSIKRRTLRIALPRSLGYHLRLSYP